MAKYVKDKRKKSSGCVGFQQVLIAEPRVYIVNVSPPTEMAPSAHALTTSFLLVTKHWAYQTSLTRPKYHARKLPQWINWPSYSFIYHFIRNLAWVRKPKGVSSLENQAGLPDCWFPHINVWSLRNSGAGAKIRLIRISENRLIVSCQISVAQNGCFFSKKTLISLTSCQENPNLCTSNLFIFFFLF